MLMNCIVVDDDDMSRHMVSRCVEQTDFLKLVKLCSNAIEASNVLRTEKVDLIFLDIEMPEMTGIEFIKNFKEKPQIILITSHEEYAVEAFEHDVTDYILKPVNYGRFLKAVTKAKDNFDSEENNNHSTSEDTNIFVKVNSRLIKIRTDDIMWIESMSDYVNILTPNGKYTVHSTMKGIIEKLPTDDFVRVHRSYIVKKDKISVIEDNTLVIDKKLIPIGKSYKDELMKSLNLI